MDTKKIQFSFQTDEKHETSNSFFWRRFSERYEMQISKEGDTLYLRQRKGDRYEIILFHLDTGILQKQNSMINVGRLSRAPELVPTEDPLENGNPEFVILKRYGTRTHYESHTSYSRYSFLE